MIEIAPKKYWIKCTFAEALLYLEFLEIDGKKGWTLFTCKKEADRVALIKPTWNKNHKYSSNVTKSYKFTCIPVRNNND